MMKRRFAFALLAGFAAVSLSAAELPRWMSGSWHGNDHGTAAEEIWSGAGGTMMVGMHRDVAPDGKTSFEFLRIEKKGDSLVYLAMPSGRPATPFPLKTITTDRVVFENLTHDFPQRIIYWRKGAELCARVEAMVKDQVEGEEWCWAR